MAQAKIPFESEKLIQIYYNGVLCGEFRLDLLVDAKVVVELKALDGLNDQHLAQAISYLKATGLKLAILINFGQKSLEVRRVVLRLSLPSLAGSGVLLLGGAFLPQLDAVGVIRVIRGQIRVICGL